MTAITNKMTKSQLVALADRLQDENGEMREYINRLNTLVDQLVDGEGCAEAKLTHLVEKTQPKLPGGNPNVQPVEESKILATMRWVMQYVGLNVKASDDFLQEFEVYTNKEKNWLAVYPKKGLPNSGKFIKELAQARHAKGIQGNYWNNYGMWMNVPVK